VSAISEAQSRGISSAAGPVVLAANAVAGRDRLIRAAGFEPLKAGGVADVGRIEMPGTDLHQASLNGAVLDLDEAQALFHVRFVDCGLTMISIVSMFRIRARGAAAFRAR
jgi:hypothetical protein